MRIDHSSVGAAQHRPGCRLALTVPSWNQAKVIAKLRSHCQKTSPSQALSTYRPPRVSKLKNLIDSALAAKGVFVCVSVCVCAEALPCPRPLPVGCLSLWMCCLPARPCRACKRARMPFPAPSRPHDRLGRGRCQTNKFYDYCLCRVFEGREWWKLLEAGRWVITRSCT